MATTTQSRSAVARPPLLYLLVLLALTLPVHSAEPPLIGAWSCHRGPCLDPEIEFAIEDGHRVFRSWLHHRPSLRGTWSTDGSTLTVTVGGGDFEYEIVRVNKKVLVLRADDDKESAHYTRITD